MMFERNLAYEASAGSGKTFMLVARYLSLLFLQKDPSKILTLTFTNKAANEMQERIISTLETLSKGSIELQVISEITEITEEEILSKKEYVLHKFLKSSPKIMTIDSFFAKILRKFSLYLALMPDFKTVQAQHEIKLLERFLKEVDVSQEKKSLVELSLLSKKNLFEILNLLDDFYTKLSELGDVQWKRDDHKVYEQEALKIIKEMESIIQNCKDASKTALNGFKVERFEDIFKKTWLERDTLDFRTFSKCFDPRLDQLFYRLKEALKKYYRAKEQTLLYSLYRLTKQYQKAKQELYKAENEVSFGDVTMMVYEILRRDISKEFLYFRLDSHIEHILLDEFQDTSIIQYEILHPLIEEILSGEGLQQEGSFFFVGDTKQSIYRFRGGVSALFYEVAKLNHTTVKKLTTNYRSQKEIVEFVNDTFRRKMKNYTDQQVLLSKQGGYVQVDISADIAQTVVQTVDELVMRGASLNDIAILCATNNDSEVFQECLVKAGYDVITETTIKLINQNSVKALLEYLKYLYFKADIFKENFFALIGRKEDITFVDFGKKTLQNIVQEAIQKYQLFDGDLNYFAFLETIGRYNNIEELLFGYERIEQDAISLSQTGVRILTVHKSKGLEFPHVIVADRLGNIPNRHDLIVYDYDGIELKNIYCHFSKRNQIDKEYENALHRVEKLKTEDTLNALYVAFTRAKENLFIIQKEEKSSFALLELQKMQRGTLHVNKKSIRSIQNNTSKKEFTEYYYGSQSDLLEKVQEMSDEDIHSQNFGTAMHYMLEMLGEFNQESIDNAYMAMLNRFGAVLEPLELQQIRDRVSRLLEDKQFQLLVIGECYKEKALKYRNKVYYIDLLIEKKEKFIIIDYKSSKSYQDEHVKQVQNYKKAVYHITKKQAQGYLCYILPDTIEIIKV